MDIYTKTLVTNKAITDGNALIKVPDNLSKYDRVSIQIITSGVTGGAATFAVEDSDDDIDYFPVPGLSFATTGATDKIKARILLNACAFIQVNFTQGAATGGTYTIKALAKSVD